MGFDPSRNLFRRPSPNLAKKTLLSFQRVRL